MTDERKAFAAYCRTCGALNGAVAESLGRTLVRESLLGWHEQGLRVESVSASYVRTASLSFCDCHSKDRARIEQMVEAVDMETGRR